MIKKIIKGHKLLKKFICFFKENLLCMKLKKNMNNG